MGQQLEKENLMTEEERQMLEVLKQALTKHKFNLSNELYRIFQDAFSLIAYSNPWSSPLGWLLCPSRRENVSTTLNSAILGKYMDIQDLLSSWFCVVSLAESLKFERRPPLEYLVAHAAELLKIIGQHSLGEDAFITIDDVFPQNWPSSPTLLKMFETTLTLPRTSVLTEPLGSVPTTSTAAVQTITPTTNTKRRRRRRNKRKQQKSPMLSNETSSSRTFDPVMTATSIRGGGSSGGGSGGTARRGRLRGVSSTSAATTAVRTAPTAAATATAAVATVASSSTVSGGSPALFVDPHDFFETLD